MSVGPPCVSEVAACEWLSASRLPALLTGCAAVGESEADPTIAQYWIEVPLSSGTFRVRLEVADSTTWWIDAAPSTTVSTHTIRAATTLDAEQIASIYNYYVANTIITFEEEPVAPSDIAGRITRVTARHPWIVREEGDRILGYAYADLWHSRCAYRLSVETTVYVASTELGRGAGTALYRTLLAQLRTLGVHCAIGAIALPNDASVALHERFGFTKVGQMKDVGRKFDRWIDVGYWQLLLTETTTSIST